MRTGIAKCVAEEKRCEQRFSDAPGGCAGIASIVRAVTRASHATRAAEEDEG